MAKEYPVEIKIVAKATATYRDGCVEEWTLGVLMLPGEFIPGEPYPEEKAALLGRTLGRRAMQGRETVDLLGGEPQDGHKTNP